MEELEARLRRILWAEAGLTLVGAVGFGWVGGWDSAGAFLATAFLSLGSMVVLGAAAKGIGGGRVHWLLWVLFVTRLLLYAGAFFAILKVYPEHDTELACGVLQGVVAVLGEALLTNQRSEESK
ncbi:MAG: hypothetical protein NW208_12725 [Bryobacter sp.]|nr:hypothetical protein [Bryobacter sp.]